MKEINRYIIEKLHLNKDIEVHGDEKYILYYRDDNNEPYKFGKVMDSLDELNELRNTILKSKPYYTIFKCPENLVDEFKQRWDDFDPLDFNQEDIRKWGKKHDIVELTAEDVNNYFYPQKK